MVTWLSNYSQEFTYSLLDTRDGLPSASITVLKEDTFGHLWIGTDAGLVRYNGYDFQYFYDEPVVLNFSVTNGK